MTENQQEKSLNLINTFQAFSDLERILFSARKSTEHAQHLLMTCCEEGSVELLRLVLTYKTSKKCLNSEIFWKGKWHFLLTYACIKNNPEIVQVLLDAGANPNVITRDLLYTPLHFACLVGNESICNQLLRTGKIDIDHVGISGWSPLAISILKNHFNIARMLLQFNAKFVNRSILNYRIPIFEAINAGSKDMVELLLSHGTNINEFTPSFLTPIQYAILKGHLEIVQLLIKKGADIRFFREDYDGQPPLIIALEKNRLDIFEALLLNSRNIDVNVCFKGKTPLCIASEKGLLDICEKLVLLGAIVEPDLKNGIIKTTPLFNACSGSGNIEVCKFLISNGALVNSICLGSTPLNQAINKGNVELINFLISNGAHVTEEVISQLGLFDDDPLIQHLINEIKKRRIEEDNEETQRMINGIKKEGEVKKYQNYFLSLKKKFKKYL